MRVGIIITNHNYGDLITKAIDSAYAQKYPDKKIIVVDDKSTDQSMEVYDQYIKKLNKVLFNQEILGPSGSKNQGIQSGWSDIDIFAFLDADDQYYHNNVISDAVNIISDNPKRIGFVYGDYEYYDTVRGYKKMIYRSPFSLDSCMDEDFVGGNLIINKRVLEVFGGFDIDMKVCENLEYVLRASQKFVSVHIPDFLTRVTNTIRSIRNNKEENELIFHRKLALKNSQINAKKQKETI